MAGIRRVRFTSEEDLLLLREVASKNPILNPERWILIQAKLAQLTGKTFSIRLLRDHTYLLVHSASRKVDNLDKLLQPGSSELLSEQQQLIQEINDLYKLVPKKAPKRERLKVCHDSTTAKILEQTMNESQNVLYLADYDDSMSAVNAEDSDELNYTVNNSCESLEDLKVEGHPDPPFESRMDGVPESLGLDWRVMQFLSSRTSTEIELKSKQLELEARRVKIEERKLALDEKRFYLKKEKQKEQFQIEREKLLLEKAERAQLQKVIESQQKIIESLMVQLDCQKSNVSN